MEELTILENKVKQTFIEKSKEYTGGIARIPYGYSVNCVAGKDYPRDCFASLKQSIREMINRGEGFTLGASWRGGWSTGVSAGTSDFSIILDSSDLIKLAYE